MTLLLRSGPIATRSNASVTSVAWISFVAVAGGNNGRFVSYILQICAGRASGFSSQSVLGSTFLANGF